MVRAPGWAFLQPPWSIPHPKHTHARGAVLCRATCVSTACTRMRARGKEQQADPGRATPNHAHLEALRACVLGCIERLVLSPPPPPLLQRRQRHLAAQRSAALGGQRLAGVLPPGRGVLVHRHLRRSQAGRRADGSVQTCAGGAAQQLCLR